MKRWFTILRDMPLLLFTVLLAVFDTLLLAGILLTA